MSFVPAVKKIKKSSDSGKFPYCLAVDAVLL